MDTWTIHWAPPGRARSGADADTEDDEAVALGSRSTSGDIIQGFVEIDE